MRFGPARLARDERGKRDNAWEAGGASKSEGRRTRNKKARARDRYVARKANGCDRRGAERTKRTDSPTWSEARSRYNTRLMLFTYIR